MTATDLADDLLRGARAIAGYTGLPTRTVYYLHARGVLPTFELPGMAGIFGRKTTLRRWIEALERGVEQNGNISAHRGPGTNIAVGGGATRRSRR